MKSRRGKSFKELLDAWRDGPLRDSLSRLPERRSEFRLDSGIPIAGLYTHLDLDASDDAGAIGLPGVYPFTRGVQPTMYRSRLWTMRQYSGFGDAGETNRRLRYLLEQGQT
ncbi:MAG: methylmalonyl-CoA mutase family protein, partial [Thermoanaerobaculia bacterium]